MRVVKIMMYTDVQRRVISRRDLPVGIGFTVLFIFHTTVFAQNTELRMPIFGTLGIIFNIVFCVYAVLVKIWGSKASKKKIFLALVPFIFFIIDLLAPATKTTIFNFLPIVTISLFCLSSDAVKRETFRLTKIILIAEAFLGIISYTLFVTNLLPPLSTVDFYEEGSTNLYVNYYYLSILYVTPTGLLCRLCCLFNEPGWLGTFCALYLIADGLNLKKIGNIVLFIAGSLAFSLAFWLLIFVYILVYSLGEKKILLFIIFACLASVISLGIVDIVSDNEGITRLFNRFTFENGSFVGDDRTSYEFMKLWNEVKNDSSKLFFGVDHYAGDMSTSSYLQYIVNYGLIGVFLLFVPFIIITLKFANRNRHSIYFFICFCASIYQRPQIFTLAYFIILFGGIEYIYSQKKQMLIK